MPTLISRCCLVQRLGVLVALPLQSDSEGELRSFRALQLGAVTDAKLQDSTVSTIHDTA